MANIEFHRMLYDNGNMEAGIFRLFSRKIVVFSETMLTSLDVNSICAIAAHEVGHAAHKHIVSAYVLKAACSCGAIILAWFYFNFLFSYSSLSDQQQIFYEICLLLEILIGIPLCIIIKNKIHQMEEQQADIYAVKMKHGRELINALKRSEKDTIRELNPHPLLHLLTSDHPPLSQRIIVIEKALSNCNQE